MPNLKYKLFTTLGEYTDVIEMDYLTQSRHGVNANAPDTIMAKKKIVD
jgi:hypothetical protein